MLVVPLFLEGNQVPAKFISTVRAQNWQVSGGGTEAQHLPWVKCQPLTSFEAAFHAGSQLEVPLFGELPHYLAKKQVVDQRPKPDRLR